MRGDLGGGSAINEEKPHLALAIGKQALDFAKEILIVLALCQIMCGIVVIAVALLGNLRIVQGKDRHHSLP